MCLLGTVKVEKNKLLRWNHISLIWVKIKNVVSHTEGGNQRILLEQNKLCNTWSQFFNWKTGCKTLVCLKSNPHSKASLMWKRFTFSTIELPPRLNFWDFDVRFVQKINKCTNICIAGMCLNSQIDAVRLLHFYWAKATDFRALKLCETSVKC